MEPIDRLAVRLERVERENRILKRVALLGFGVFSGLALVAWQSPQGSVMDTLQVRRLEVLDSRGVPMITLSPTRNNTGGSIVMRDNSGEKRSWWETDSGAARIVFESPAGKTDDRTIAGLSTEPGKAQMSLLGPKGGSVLNSVQGDQPSLSLRNSKGDPVFSAPWAH